MARKNIKTAIDDTEFDVFIRRVKTRELKALVTKLAEKGDIIVNAFGSEDFAKRLPGLIVENLDFISNECILPFTELSPERLDEMDVVDVVGLTKELLKYNGIDVVQIVNFLKPKAGTMSEVMERMGFEGKPIPL